MHELAIAQSILGIIHEHIPPGGEARFRRASVRIGPLAGVVADSLEFCFQALVQDGPLAAGRLEIVAAPMRARCEPCGRELELAEPVFACPECGAPGLRVTGGHELQVTEIELAEREGNGEAA